MDARKVIGNFFEEEVMRIFSLERADILSEGNVPDTRAKDKSFYVEVKASSYTNGGVITSRQLDRFDKEINSKRFYAFCYHSITKHLERDYKTEKLLTNALDLKSLYLFPFSIVKSHYINSNKRGCSSIPFVYVQLKESDASRIFQKDNETWEKLRLEAKDYDFFQKKNLYVVTRQGKLDEIVGRLSKSKV